MSANAQLEPTPERLMQMSWGYAPPLILEAAVKHRLFDLLDASPKTAPQLAKEAKVSLRGVTAICNALVGLRLVARSGDGYQNTPESGAFLVSTKPAYHGEFFRHVSSQLIPKWLALDKAVRTGNSVGAVNSEKKGTAFFAKFVESIFPLELRRGQGPGRAFGNSRCKKAGQCA
jgi:hypothetical protein